MTKNDRAWETLFSRHQILHDIHTNGYYRITADMIREEREPRLMCKFDHESNLPKLFQEHGLSILPISRSEYIIGPFSIFEDVSYETQTPIKVTLPPYVDTVNTTDLYSESATLHAAFVSGMFHQVLELSQDAPLLQTVSGRMGSKQFDYEVAVREGTFPIEVVGSQIEIDGGYEGEKDFIIVEAKKEAVRDFNIRQLFYPYRVWSKRTNKKITPVFFTHSNDIFTFFVYEFRNANVFNSIRLVKQMNFMIDVEAISMQDIIEIAKETKGDEETYEIPFPQADSFERVVDLLSLLYEQSLTKDMITENYDFTARQSDYYTNIGRYLRLIEKETKQGQIQYKLSSLGESIMGLPYKQKYLELTRCLFKKNVFRRVFLEWVPSMAIRKDRIVTIMQEEKVGILAESTLYRRAQTVIKWMDWVKRLCER